MKRSARARPRCGQCPFCSPSGGCLDAALKSGRCGSWIWFVRGGKQLRRRYVRPRDPATLAQLRSRDRLSVTSWKYSALLTDEQQDACIAAGAKVQSRPRLDQSGTLTGQQFHVHREYARDKAKSKVTKVQIASQLTQPQQVTRTSWDTRRGHAGVTPRSRRPDAPPAGKLQRKKKPVAARIKQELPPSRVRQNQMLLTMRS
jgi:hypothetical protein